MSIYSDSWLKFEEALGGVRPVLRGTAEEMRGQYKGLGDLIASQHSPVSESQVVVSNGEVSGTKYRTYTPHGCETKSLPIGIFYHAGGFVVGNLDAEDSFCRNLALNANLIIISVDYRLSPEHKAPAHLEDAVTLYEWAYSNAEVIGGDYYNMFTIGTSAGGGLALAVARKVKLGQTSLPVNAIKGVIALCPVIFHPQNIPEEHRAKHLSYKDNKENVPIIDEATLLQMFDNTGIKSDDEGYFPLLDGSCLKLFPRTYLVTCGQDPLRDDGKVLHDSFVSAGVPAKIDHYGEMPHCFWIVPSLPETAVFFNQLIGGVQWVIKAT